MHEWTGSVKGSSSAQKQREPAKSKEYTESTHTEKQEVGVMTSCCKRWDFSSSSGEVWSIEKQPTCRGWAAPPSVLWLDANVTVEAPRRVFRVHVSFVFVLLCMFMNFNDEKLGLVDDKMIEKKKEKKKVFT